MVFVNVVAGSAAGIKAELGVDGENTKTIATGPMPAKEPPIPPEEDGSEGEDGKSGEDGVKGEDGNSGGDGVNEEPGRPVPPDGDNEGNPSTPGAVDPAGTTGY